MTARNPWQVRVAAGQAATRQLEAAADGALAEVLHECPAPPPWQGDALASALAALGRAQRLALAEAPERPSSRLERLEAVARRAALRLLPLCGAPGELESAALGFRSSDGAPVVLLPASGRGHLFTAQGDVASFRMVACPELEPQLFAFVAPLPAARVGLRQVVSHALRGQSKGLLLLLLFSLLGAALALLLPWAKQGILDGAVPDGDSRLLLLIGAGLLTAAVCRGAMQCSLSLLLLRIQGATSLRTRLAIWDRVLRLPYSFFRRYAKGDLLQRIEAVEQARNQLEQALAGLFLSGSFGLLNLGLLFVLCPPLALIAAALTVLRGGATLLAGWLRLRAQRRTARLAGENFAWNVQMLDGLAKLRCAAAERRAFAQWGVRFAEQLKTSLQAARIHDRFSVVQTVLGHSGRLLLYLGAALLAAGGGLSIGLFVAFQAAFASFLSTTDSLSESLLQLGQLKVLLERAQPVLETPLEPQGRMDPGRLRGHVRLENVRFGYGDDEAGVHVLQDVHIEARPGEMIALVGPSGCGKSTVCKLLLGLEQPSAGRVLFDGHDLRSLDLEAVRRQLGAVLQNPTCLGGSLFEMIAAGRELTEAEAWEACKAASIDAELRALPMQLQTRLGPGARELSGGQLQRLLLARALARKPALLVLDEATSALDSANQQRISRELEKRVRTRIVVAHRLDSVRNADRIYVFEAGRVVGQGSFDQLARGCPAFRRLLRAQAPATTRLRLPAERLPAWL